MRWIFIGLLALSLAGCGKSKKSNKKSSSTSAQASSGSLCQQWLDKQIAIMKAEEDLPPGLAEQMADEEQFAAKMKEGLARCKAQPIEVIQLGLACTNKARSFDDSSECNRLKIFEQGDAQVSKECLPACNGLVDRALEWKDTLDKVPHPDDQEWLKPSLKVRLFRRCLSACIQSPPPTDWKACVTSAQSPQALKKCAGPLDSLPAIWDPKHTVRIEGPNGVQVIEVD